MSPQSATVPQCAICQHPSRGAIEQALATGRPTRAIAATFSTPEHPFSKSSVGRHKPHIVVSTQEVAQARGLTSAGALITLVEDLIGELCALKNQAKLDPIKGGPEVRKSAETILKAVQVLADLTGANAPKISVQVQAELPTPSEAASWSKECLLTMLNAREMRSFARELLERAEQGHLLVEAGVPKPLPAARTAETADAPESPPEPTTSHPSGAEVQDEVPQTFDLVTPQEGKE